jgi:hypothetical protein
MGRRVPPAASATNQSSPGMIPEGAPAWITPELIALTLHTWQPYYRVPLTPAEACEMILTATELFAVLSREKHREAVRRLGTSQQPGART